MSVARLSRPEWAYRLRPRTRQQKGFTIAVVMCLFILLAGTVYMNTATAGRTIKTAVLAKDFTDSGSLADYAVQQAVYTLNEQFATSTTFTLPTAAAPATGTSSTGSWTWYADPVTAGDGGGRKTTIHASGTYRGDTRNATAVVGSLNVGGFKVQSDNRITYEEGPGAAWTHALLGRSVTAQNGPGVGGTFLTGSVGITGAGPLTTTPYSGTAATTSLTALLYGGQAANLNIDGAVKIPAGLNLDAQFVTDNLARCAAPADWKASDHGGVLNANDNSGCYNTMTFDVPTTIIGSGAFNAFVTGGVNFNDSVTATSSTTALNIYTNGSVSFNTTALRTDLGDTQMSLSNTFIFAPQGACKTVPFRDLTYGLTFTGSMACDTVNAAGQFTWAPPVHPLGGELYNREVWFLTDYNQPAGMRN